MENNKTSKAQLNAVKNWEDNNKTYASYLKSRSSAKSFIKNKATIEDLENFEQLIKEVKENKYNEK
jgi:hypothetical protein